MARVELDLPSAAAAPASKPGHTFRGRLFRKYLLLILVLVGGALLTSGAVSIYFGYQENKAAIGTLQNEKAVGAASRIEQYIDRITQQLAYASLPQIDASDLETRRIEFLKLLRQAPEVTDIAQLDASGREVIAVSRLGMDRLNSQVDRAQEPAFVDAKRGKPWYSPVYFRKDTEPYMTISLRSGGERGPVTIADVNLKFIWDVVSRIKIGEKGKAYVVDRSGYLVADPDIGLVLRKTDLANLPHVKAATSGPPSPDEPALKSGDLAGTPVLVSWAPIETLGWNVFVEQPIAEVYARLNASIVRTGLLLLAGLVISALGAAALARGMVRPIRTLEEGAQHIGEGNLDQRIDVRTGDELEALAGRFNRMSAQLKESYAGLERKVEARTQELSNSLEQQTAISEILRDQRDPACHVELADRRGAGAPGRRRARGAPLRRAVRVRRPRGGKPAAPGRLSRARSGAGQPLRASEGAQRTVPPEADVRHRSRRGRPRDGARSRHPAAARHRVSRRAAHPAALRLPRDPCGSADARGRRLRGDPHLAAGAGTVLARPDRAAPDVRAAGGDRHRQRAPVQRDPRSARPADRDQ